MADPELNKATLAAVAEPDPAKRLGLYKRCRKPCSSIRRTSLLTRESQIVVRDNVKGYQQGLNADMVWYDNVTK